MLGFTNLLARANNNKVRITPRLMIVVEKNKPLMNIDARRYKVMGAKIMAKNFHLSSLFERSKSEKIPFRFPKNTSANPKNMKIDENISHFKA